MPTRSCLARRKVSQAGRFLVEAERDLPVGNYIIRADVLDSDGVKVIARAAVPFEREPGEDMAAVAPPADAAAEPPATVAAAAAGAARSARRRSRQSRRPPRTGAASRGSRPATETPPARGGRRAASGGARCSRGRNRHSLPKQPPAVARDRTACGWCRDRGAPPPETTAPKLQKVQGAVIIRRGDSLWRISRRVYGHGIRYSTIYLANQEQIRDPDRIWPGQVFRMPDKTRKASQPT